MLPGEDMVAHGCTCQYPAPYLTQPEPLAQALSRTVLPGDSGLFLDSQSHAPSTHPLPRPGPPQPSSDLRPFLEFN